MIDDVVLYYQLDGDYLNVRMRLRLPMPHRLIGTRYQRKDFPELEEAEVVTGPWRLLNGEKAWYLLSAIFTWIWNYQKELIPCIWILRESAIREGLLEREYACPDQI